MEKPLYKIGDIVYYYGNKNFALKITDVVNGQYHYQYINIASYNGEFGASLVGSVESIYKLPTPLERIL